MRPGARPGGRPLGATIRTSAAEAAGASGSPGECANGEQGPRAAGKGMRTTESAFGGRQLCLTIRIVGAEAEPPKATGSEQSRVAVNRGFLYHGRM